MSIIGIHCHKNGSKPFFKAKPRIMKSMDNRGWMEEAKKESEGHTVTLFRDTTVYLEAPPDLHNPPGTWDQMANYWLHECRPCLYDVWRSNPADVYAIGNEQGGNDPAHIQDTINYQRSLMKYANEAGFVVGVGGLADSTPHWELWVEYWFPFIQEAFKAGNYYIRHVYGEGLLVDAVTGKPLPRLQRAIDELEYLKQHGIPGGAIFDEFGLNGGSGVVSTATFLFQITHASMHLEPYSDWLVGFCWWDAGNVHPWYADYTKLLEHPELLDWMEMWPSEPWKYPDAGYKSVVYKVAQEHSNTDWHIIADKAFKDFKRTLTSSIDNAIVMALDGNTESYIKVFDPDLPSQVEAIKAFEAAGITVVTEHLVAGNPLDGLKFGHLFNYAYALTSPFNAPRDYSAFGGKKQDKHEGADYDVVGGQVDNIVGVLCLYPGEVDFVKYSNGYGQNVRVKHERHGSTFYTRYAHLDEVWVEVGQILPQGEPIGEVGSTGNATGEHVHLNVEVPEYGLDGYIVANVVDPNPYMPDGAGSLPPIGSGKLFNMSDYIIGPADGSAIEVRHPDGRTETFQYQYDSANNTYFLVKNGWWEEFRVTPNFIQRGRDISAGPAPNYAERPGALRWYWQFEGIGSFAKWCPMYMREGGAWSGLGHYVQYYYYDNCAQSEANSGSATNYIHFKAHWPSIVFNGIEVQDVIELTSGTGETFYFGFKRGLVAWKDADGRSSQIVEVFVPGQRTLERKPICTPN